MKLHFRNASLRELCELFGKTRQAFYDHAWRYSDNQLKEALVLDLVARNRVLLPKVGCLKLFHMLKEDFIAHKITLGRDSFFALMRENQLLVKIKKRYIKTTDSNHPFRKWPDLTKSFTLKAAEQLWVSDITYIKTENGFIYLSLITDAYSKKIVGHHLSQYLKVQGCLIALDKALSTVSSIKSLIHHSDRGIQYCCEPYVSILLLKKIRVSMTQTGSPYDNAVAERVNGILKNELNLDKTFVCYNDAVAGVHKAIDIYNRLRPHMSCNNLTPEKAHHEKNPLIKKWKSKKYVKHNQ